MNPWFLQELVRDRQAELQASMARKVSLGRGRRARRRTRGRVWPRRRRAAAGGFRLTVPGGPTEGLWP